MLVVNNIYHSNNLLILTPNYLAYKADGFDAFDIFGTAKLL